MLALKPERGKPAFRNFREGDGNGGIIRSPLRAIALPDKPEKNTLILAQSRAELGCIRGGAGQERFSGLQSVGFLSGLPLADCDRGHVSLVLVDTLMLDEFGARP